MIETLIKVRDDLDDKRIETILELAMYVQEGMKADDPIDHETLDLFNKSVEDIYQQLHDVDIEIDKLDHTKEECQHEAFTSFGAPQVCAHCRLGL